MGTYVHGISLHAIMLSDLLSYYVNWNMFWYSRAFCFLHDNFSRIGFAYFTFSYHLCYRLKCRCMHSETGPT